IRIPLVNGESRERVRLRSVVLQASSRMVPAPRHAQRGAAHIVVLGCLLLAGCAASSHAASDDEPVTWRVATYNIHHARGTDDSVSVERIADVLRSLDADIIALQEV